MKRYVEGEDRSQASMFPERLDDYITEDNPVRVIDVYAGLHVVGFTPAGSLVVTSVYASVDQSGRYMAVMSSHGQAAGHESIQVYDACDLSVSR